MQRRMFVAALAGGGLWWPAAAGAAMSGAGCFEGADRLTRCSVGFSSLPPIPPQPCRALCWATCLAYMLRGFGAQVTEADVLARQELDPACRPHAGKTRITASMGDWTDRDGRRFLMSAKDLLSATEMSALPPNRVMDPRFSRLIARLHRQPVLCGAAGHTTVLAELHSFGDRFGRMWIDRVRVLDPYPPSRGMRDLTAAELQRPSYVYGIAVRPLDGLTNGAAVGR